MMTHSKYQAATATRWKVSSKYPGFVAGTTGSGGSSGDSISIIDAYPWIHAWEGRLYPTASNTWQATSASINLNWDATYQAIPTQSTTNYFYADGIGSNRVDTLVRPGSDTRGNSGYYLINQNWFTGSARTDIAWLRCMFVRGTGSAANQYFFQNLVDGAQAFALLNTSATQIRYTLINTTEGGDNFSVNWTTSRTGSFLADLFYERDRGSGNTIVWGILNGVVSAVTGTGLTEFPTGANLDDLGILGNRAGDQNPGEDFKWLGLWFSTGSVITLAEHLADYSASCVI